MWRGKRRQTEALFRAQAAIFPALVDKLAEQIARNNQTELLETIELPLARVLAHMEAIGFLVDAKGIAQYGEMLQAEIDRIQGEIYQSVGYEFNSTARGSSATPSLRSSDCRMEKRLRRAIPPRRRFWKTCAMSIQRSK